MYGNKEDIIYFYLNSSVRIMTTKKTKGKGQTDTDRHNYDIQIYRID